MSKNVGTLDRIARLIGGLILTAYAVPIGFPLTDSESCLFRRGSTAGGEV